jgi:hypothetical protein
MWRPSLATMTAIALCGASAEPAFACDGCGSGYAGYRYYYADPAQAGFHEHYGFYVSVPS